MAHDRDLVAGLAAGFAALHALLLFARLRERTRECDALLAERTQEHRAGAALFERVRGALASYTAGEHKDGAGFPAAVNEFAEAQWRHMRAEESLVVPAASRHLRPSDWAEIGRAFKENADPRFGGTAGNHSRSWRASC